MYQRGFNRCIRKLWRHQGCALGLQTVSGDKICKLKYAKYFQLYSSSNKKFKGIAYIEFTKEQDAQKAVIGGNGMDIGGQNVRLTIYPA